MHTATVLPHSFQLQNDSLGSGGGGGAGAQITSSSHDMVKRSEKGGLGWIRPFWTVKKRNLSVCFMG